MSGTMSDNNANPEAGPGVGTDEVQPGDGMPEVEHEAEGGLVSGTVPPRKFQPEELKAVGSLLVGLGGNAFMPQAEEQPSADAEPSTAGQPSVETGKGTSPPVKEIAAEFVPISGPEELPDSESAVHAPVQKKPPAGPLFRDDRLHLDDEGPVAAGSNKELEIPVIVPSGEGGGETEEEEFEVPVLDLTGGGDDSPDGDGTEFDESAFVELKEQRRKSPLRPPRREQVRPEPGAGGQEPKAGGEGEATPVRKRTKAPPAKAGTGIPRAVLWGGGITIALLVVVLVASVVIPMFRSHKGGENEGQKPPVVAGKEGKAKKPAAAGSPTGSGGQVELTNNGKEARIPVDEATISAKKLFIEQEDMDPIVGDMAKRFHRVQITSIAANMGAGRVYDKESPFRAQIGDVARSLGRTAQSMEEVVNVTKVVADANVANAEASQANADANKANSEKLDEVVGVLREGFSGMGVKMTPAKE